MRWSIQALSAALQRAPVYSGERLGSPNVVDVEMELRGHPRAELRLPAESIAPALARAGIRGMTRELPDRAAADLALLTTEVVANSVKHGTRSLGDEIVVRLYVDDRVRVEVDDRGPGFGPRDPFQPRDLDASGWGLYLLDTLSARWGVDTANGTTTVWFELDPRSGR